MAERARRPIEDPRDALGLRFVAPDVPAPLRPFVHSWSGYTERTLAPCWRREFPTTIIPLIFELGPAIEVFETGRDDRSQRYRGGFLAGPADAFTLTMHAGFQRGLQVNLTSAGARRLLRMPLDLLVGQVVSITDLLAPADRAITDRLGSMPSWDARFAHLTELLLARLRPADHTPSPIDYAIAQIEAAHGRVALATLADELGYSHKHMIALMRTHVGFTPKLYASIVRFDHVVATLRAGRPGSWAQLAAAAGYADQAHLAREVRRFAGLTPTQLVGELAPVA